MRILVVAFVQQGVLVGINHSWHQGCAWEVNFNRLFWNMVDIYDGHNLITSNYHRFVLQNVIRFSVDKPVSNKGIGLCF